MANDYFAFKRFTVRQPRSAMRVGTDGVLLGAWCDSAPAGGRMLDVGTGTGVIALILAQRNPSARIDAVEIDEGSCLDAEGNFAASPWAGRLTLYRRPFRFRGRMHGPVRSDRVESSLFRRIAQIARSGPHGSAACGVPVLCRSGRRGCAVARSLRTVVGNLACRDRMRLCGIGFERGIVPGARTGRAYGSGRSRQAAVRGVFPPAAGFAGGDARDRSRRPPRVQCPLQRADGRFLPEDVSLFLEK